MRDAVIAKLKRMSKSQLLTVYLILNERNKYGLTCQVVISGSPSVIGLMGEDMEKLNEDVLLKEVPSTFSLLGSLPGIEIAILKRSEIH